MSDKKSWLADQLESFKSIDESKARYRFITNFESIFESWAFDEGSVASDLNSLACELHNSMILTEYDWSKFLTFVDEKLRK